MVLTLGTTLKTPDGTRSSMDIHRVRRTGLLLKRRSLLRKPVRRTLLYGIDGTSVRADETCVRRIDQGVSRMPKIVWSMRRRSKRRTRVVPSCIYLQMLDVAPTIIQPYRAQRADPSPRLCGRRGCQAAYFGPCAGENFRLAQRVEL